MKSLVAVLLSLSLFALAGGCRVARTCCVQPCCCPAACPGGEPLRDVDGPAIQPALRSLRDGHMATRPHDAFLYMDEGTARRSIRDDGEEQSRGSSIDADLELPPVPEIDTEI